MDSTAAGNVARAKDWLSTKVFPLWAAKGIAPDGGFIEAMDWSGAPLDLPRRAMVQARQIYAFRTGMTLGCVDETTARSAIARAASFLIEKYSLPSGAFRHSIPSASKPGSETTDLYTQAFALFGLANAHACAPAPEHKRRALALLDYLQNERRFSDGGFTELEEGRAVRRSNPHMHLFEAAVAWMKVDADPRWKSLAAELLELCLSRFIDPATGALGERFVYGWALEREGGRFFFEPGHQYEWSWLMILHAESGGRDAGAAVRRMFENAEAFGLSPEGDAYDEVWSDGTPRKKSSRFWPQSERIKAAVRLGRAAAADQAYASLDRFLQVPRPGLWRDTRLETGEFREEPAKASSLYHIINAFDEYAARRPAPTLPR